MSHRYTASKTMVAKHTHDIKSLKYNVNRMTASMNVLYCVGYYGICIDFQLQIESQIDYTSVLMVYQRELTTPSDQAS